uniref:DUF4366 domain-containing protein n=1 Tax=Faecalicatena contorta TaxID=39482 RepID=UPI00359C507E
MRMKKNNNRLLRGVAVVLCLALMFFTMSGMAMATGEPDAADSVPEITEAVIDDAPKGAEETPVSEESEPPISEPTEPTPEDAPPETSEIPEAEYEMDADIPAGWHNAPVTVTVRIRDKNNAGWQRVEAALRETAERTDLTEQLAHDGLARYTVPDNGIVFFFVTDPYGTEHKKELTVSCMDFEAPRLRAGVSGTLLRVEAADTLSGIAGVYVNDELYTTLQNGEFSVRIDKNTRDSHFYIMGVDNAGNRTGYLVIANPFYEKETPVPSPTPEQHSTHCPADCDCRKQPSGNTGSNGGNTGAGKPSNASGSTEKPAAAQTPAAAEPAKAQEPAGTAAPVAIEKGTGFSQNGSAVTRDLLYDKYTNKQFIAVETRNGHTLYLVIDYDKPLDEDGERYETYFLNLVDESDLLALIDREDSAPVCSCKDKCEAGAVNTACAVCKNNMTECMGKEKAAEKTPEPDPTPDTTDSPDKDGGEKKSGSGLVVIVLLLLMAGGGALYWFKLRKPKPDTKGPVDLDDYDYGDEDEEYENEDDEDEPEETEGADA